MKWVKLIIVGIVVICAFSITFAGPSILLNPTTGPVGLTLVVNGSGFLPTTGVTVTFGGSYVFTMPSNVSVDQNGQFQCSIIVPDKPNGSYEVKASAYTLFASSFFTVSISPTTGSISGVVTNGSTGGRVIGATLMVNDGSPKYTTSDANGNYSFTNINQGTWQLEVYKIGYNTYYSQVSVVQNQNTYHNVVLMPAATTGSVSGKVTNSSNGQVVIGATLVMVKDGSAKYASSDTNGNYLFNNIDIGTWQLEVYASGYNTYYSQISVMQNQNTSHNVVLMPTVITGSISGKVTSSTDGSRVIGATLIVNVNDGGVHYTISDANGNYSFTNINQGTWQLEISKTGYTTAYYNVVVNAGQNTALDVVLMPTAPSVTTGNISGRVKESGSNQTISGVTLMVNDGIPKYTTTDAMGAYSFKEINAGTWSIEVRKSGYSPLFDSVAVTSGGNTSKNFYLVPVSVSATGRISGRVKNSSNFQTISGATLILNDGTPRYAISDANGNYVFNNINAGTWQLEVYALGYNAYYSQVNIVQNQNTSYDVLLIPTVTTGNISGKVINSADGHGVAGVTLVLNDGVPKYGISGSDGHYSFSNINAGTWQLEVLKSGFVPKMETVIISSNQDTKKDIFIFPAIPTNSFISAIPNSGPIGTNVEVNGQNFGSNERIQGIGWKWIGGESQLATNPPAPFNADSGGGVHFSFVVPQNVTPGTTYEVRVYGLGLTHVVSTQFTVTSIPTQEERPANILITNVIINSFLVKDPNALANQPDAKPFQIDVQANSTGFVIFEMNFKGPDGKLYFKGKTTKLPVNIVGLNSFFPGPGFFAEVWSDTTTTKLKGGIYTFSVKVVSVSNGSSQNISIPIAEDTQPPVSVPAPYLISPVDTTVTTNLPTFVWSPVPGANKYKIWVSLNQNPEVDPRWTETVDHPNTQATYPSGVRQLDIGAKFYWRVQALQLDATGSLKPIGGLDGKSNISSFKIGFAGGIEKISVISPKGEVELRGPLMFNWVPVPNVGGYEVIVSDDPSMGSSIWKMSTQGASIIYPPGSPKLRRNKRYFWGVIALDQNGQPVGSSVQAGTTGSGWKTYGLVSDIIPFSIKIVFSSNKINIISPKGEVRHKQVMFVWSPIKEASFYMLSLSDSPDGLTNPFYKIITPATSVMYPPDAPKLEASKRYFWGVVALDEDKKPLGENIENSPKSKITKFYLKEEKVFSEKLSIIGPKGKVMHKPIVFAWNVVLDADTYMVAVSDDPSMSRVIWKGDSKTSSIIYPPDAVEIVPKKKYYWQVAALDKDKKVIGKPSDVVSFDITEDTPASTFTPLSMQDAERILKQMIIDQKILNEIKDYNLIMIQLDPPGKPGDLEKIIDALKNKKARIVEVKVKER